MTLDLNTAKFDIKKKWPKKDGSINEATSANQLQYLTRSERIFFVNELHRVLAKDGKASILIPCHTANKYYGDISIEWPPVVEAWFFYLNEDWRKANAPKEKRYKCNFDATWGYGMHPAIATRNQEYQQHAITYFKEAAQDLVVTLIKR